LNFWFENKPSGNPGDHALVFLVNMVDLVNVRLAADSGLDSDPGIFNTKDPKISNKKKFSIL
jgi:hypothetical protein